MSNTRFYTIYNNILPNELDVIKFTDSYYNGTVGCTINQHLTAQIINDMGRTINAISFLASKWFCSNSKLVKSNILDSRGCWQIKARPNPAINKYTVTVEDRFVDGKYKYSIYNSAITDKTIPQDVWKYFDKLVSKFIKIMNEDVHRLICQLTISYQINMQNGKWYYIIDNIMMPDEFTINGIFTGTGKDEYCFFSMDGPVDTGIESPGPCTAVSLNSHLPFWPAKPEKNEQKLEMGLKMSVNATSITEVEINSCYNRLFKVLENCPGFINTLTDRKPDTQITKRILYDAKTIEKYITDANTETNGRYYS